MGEAYNWVVSICLNLSSLRRLCCLNTRSPLRAASHFRMGVGPSVGDASTTTEHISGSAFFWGKANTRNSIASRASVRRRAFALHISCLSLRILLISKLLSDALRLRFREKNTKQNKRKKKKQFWKKVHPPSQNWNKIREIGWNFSKLDRERENQGEREKEREDFHFVCDNPWDISSKKVDTSQGLINILCVRGLFLSLSSWISISFTIHRNLKKNLFFRFKEISSLRTSFSFSIDIISFPLEITFFSSPTRPRNSFLFLRLFWSNLPLKKQWHRNISMSNNFSTSGEQLSNLISV